MLAIAVPIVLMFVAYGVEGNDAGMENELLNGTPKIGSI